MKVGIYIGRSLQTDGIDLESIASYSRTLPGVALVRLLGNALDLDPEALGREIRAEGLDRIVIAGDSPGYFKPAFTRAMATAGGSAEEVRLASFREHGCASGDVERARSVVASAVLGVPFSLLARPREAPVNPATLIVGGGVAGIQAALEIADAGKKVVLVERSSTIGGHMAMFDKTFPTLDCAACILTPKMVAVGDHDNIDVLTLSEVEEVHGTPGAFRVGVVKHARRVDVDSCIACNACTNICPISVLSEFEAGLIHRKAIYIAFPQAVPNANVVDAEHCTWVISGGKKCGACLKKCPKDCIELDQQDEHVELEVGNIILATGFDVFDATSIERYGYGRYPNVLTSLEFERLTNASGPTGGKIVLKTEKLNKRTKVNEWIADEKGPEPKSVAIVHCAGSRDANFNAYCSRVCCMYSLKFAHLVHEKLPRAVCHEFYIDMRAFGKGYEEFLERIKSEGTHIVRGRVASVSMSGGRMSITAEDTIHDELVELPVDMVILAAGAVPSKGTRELAELLGLPRDPDGWFSELNYNGAPTETERGGVFLAGMCQGPKDIPDSVAQGSAAAAQALRSIASGCSTEDLGTPSLCEIEECSARFSAQEVVGR